MALKKSELYSPLWSSCDELRGGMDASQYKDYVLFMLFIKYISDKYGKSDDFGFNVAENPVPVHDLNATVLHLLGLDHERLTYRYAGRDFRLTDVYGNVVRAVVA